MDSWIHRRGETPRFKAQIRKYVAEHGFDMVLLALADLAHEAASGSRKAESWLDLETKIVDMVEETFGPPRRGGAGIR